MIKTKYIVMTLTMAFALLGCDLLQESEIKGTLTINPKSGWNELEFPNAKGGTKFKLKSGVYTFKFDSSWLPMTDPKINIHNANGERVGVLVIPRKQIKPDGTFEIGMNHETNRNSFNILGGRRTVIVGRQRFTKIRAYCTYQESYTCTTTNAEGKTETSTCTRTVSGDQDQIWERRQVKSLYRILFDGGDLVNVGDFTGESSIRTEQSMLDATSCG